MKTATGSGDIDTSFGVGGVVELPGSGTGNHATCVSVISTGGMYVGYSFDQGYRIARLTEAGELDVSFAKEGVITDTFYHGSTKPLNVGGQIFQLIHTNEYLTVVGQLYVLTLEGARFYPAMARYHKHSGALDTSFAENGFKVFDRTLDGRINPIGITGEAGGSESSALGSVGGGRLVREGDTLYAVINGLIERGGEYYSAAGVLCFNLDGEVDEAFGDRGLVIVKHDTFGTALYTGCAEGEGLYFSGRVGTADNSFATGLVVKLTRAGDIVPEFGFRLLAFNAQPYGLFVAQGQTLMAVGWGTNTQTITIGVQFGLDLRKGEPEPAFNNGQPLITELGTTPIFLRSGLAGADGYWVGGRYSKEALITHAALGKFHFNGVPDVGFGQQGWTFTMADKMSDCLSGPSALVHDAKGRIVIAGYRRADPIIPTVARFFA